MSRFTAWFVHVAVALTGVTGLVYGWMRYFVEPEDEFAIANHPWQPDVMHLHILVAPLLVFACGVLWRTHVWARLVSGYALRRRTGLVLAVLLAPMVATGYLVQVSSGDWRTAWIWIHAISSTAWILTYVWHQLGRRPPALSHESAEHADNTLSAGPR